jgi:hypothetical protein
MKKGKMIMGKKDHQFKEFRFLDLTESDLEVVCGGKPCYSNYPFYVDNDTTTYSQDDSSSSGLINVPIASQNSNFLNGNSILDIL